MESLVRCPHCGLLNPPSTTRCDCGYEFPQKTAEPAVDQASRLSELESRLARWEQELERLTTQIGEIHREVRLLRPRTSGALPEAERKEAPPSSPQPPRPVAPEGTTPRPPAAEPPPIPRGTGFRAFQPPGASFLSEKRAAWMSTPEWETIIGGSWLAKIGIVALVLGVLYFLKYAFDNQWIGNTGRVLIGAFSGLALLYGGERLQTRGYRLYGQTLAGGGVCILYLSIYAAFNFYSLIGQLPAILLMTLVTAVCCALSYRHSSPTLATLGLTGGLLTPYWLRTGTSNQIGLLSYLLVLDIGGAWLARVKKWQFLNLITFAGTALLFAGWAEKFYRAEDVWTTEIYLVVFAALYLGIVWDWAIRLPEDSAFWKIRLPWVFAGAVAVVFFISNEVLFFENARRFWVFVVLFALLALAAAWRARSGLVALIAFLLCVIGMLPWFPLEYSEERRQVVVAALTMFWAAFLLFDLVRVRVAAHVPNWSSLALAGVNGFVFFGFTYSLLKDDYSGWMGLLAVGVATAHLIVGRLLLKTGAARSLVFMQIGIALTLVTLSIPIQLEQDWVTIGWGLEALVLVWIGFKTGAARMRQAGLIVLGLCLIRLFAWTALQLVPDYSLVFNRRFMAFLAVAAIVGLVALLYRKRSETGVESNLFTPLVLAAYTVLLIGASQEAWTYYDHQQGELHLAVEREEMELVDLYRLSESLTNRGQLVVSLLWGVMSILAVVAGIIRRYRPIRLFGIGLFVLAIAKVFLLDIWALEQIYRIISTIALGTLLLGVAFLYQRFKGLVLSPTGQDCVPAGAVAPEEKL